MANSNESMRDRLLSRLPQPENAADYQNRVAELLAKNDKGLRRERWGTTILWFFVVLMVTVLLVGAGFNAQKPAAAYIGTASICFLIYGAVELLKHFINRSRVELLKEVKQLQLQVLELQASVKKQGI